MKRAARTNANTRVNRRSTSIMQLTRAAFARRRAALRRGLHRTLCGALIIALLAAQTPAAPLLLTGAGARWQQNLAFWFQSSGLARTLSDLAAFQRGNKPGRQETQQERSGRVARLQVSPDDATIRTGERIQFAAIAYDQLDAPVGGLRFIWRAFDVENKRPVRISRHGEFEPRFDGTFRIVAEAGGLTSEAQVKVTRGEPVPRGQTGPAAPRLVARAAAQRAAGARAQAGPHAEGEQTRATFGHGRFRQDIVRVAARRRCCRHFAAHQRGLESRQLHVRRRSRQRAWRPARRAR